METVDRAIEYSVLVRAEPEAVYDAFTTSKGLDGWFTVGSKVDARPGGQIKFRWQDWGPDKVNLEDGGPVIEAERPKRFVFQWSPDNKKYATTVELKFERVPGGTVVSVRETGYHDTDSGHWMMLHCACGWGQALTLCKFYVEHGVRY